MTMQESAVRARIATPIGSLVAHVEAGRLVALDFAGSMPSARHLPDAVGCGDALAARVARELGEFFARRRTTFDVPLAPRGTAFQQRVWTALLAIPYGTTASYADVARAIGQPTAVRAVGLANGRNPIPILIPCHRVIGSDGSLTGYAGGLAIKRALLRLEGSPDRESRQPALFA